MDERPESLPTGQPLMVFAKTVRYHSTFFNQTTQILGSKGCVLLNSQARQDLLSLSSLAVGNTSRTPQSSAVP